MAIWRMLYGDQLAYYSRTGCYLFSISITVPHWLGPTISYLRMPCGDNLAYSSRSRCYLLSIPIPVPHGVIKPWSSRTWFYLLIISSPLLPWPGATLSYWSMPYVDQLAWCSRTRFYLLLISSPLLPWPGATLSYWSMPYVDQQA